MQEPFDVQALTTRFGALAKQVRKSDAYPALVGAIVGGLVGALIAALMVGRSTSRRDEAVSAAVGDRTPAKARGGWTARELVELLTVVASLANQVRTWYEERNKR